MSELHDRIIQPRPVVSDAVSLIQAVISFPLDRETLDAIEGIVLRVAMAVEASSRSDDLLSSLGAQETDKDSGAEQEGKCRE